MGRAGARLEEPPLSPWPRASPAQNEACSLTQQLRFYEFEEGRGGPALSLISTPAEGGRLLPAVSRRAHVHPPAPGTGSQHSRKLGTCASPGQSVCSWSGGCRDLCCKQWVAAMGSRLESRARPPIRTCLGRQGPRSWGDPSQGGSRHPWNPGTTPQHSHPNQCNWHPPRPGQLRPAHPGVAHP